jgi:hypothetical protein
MMTAADITREITNLILVHGRGSEVMVDWLDSLACAAKCQSHNQDNQHNQQIFREACLALAEDYAAKVDSRIAAE